MRRAVRNVLFAAIVVGAAVALAYGGVCLYFRFTQSRGYLPRLTLPADFHFTFDRPFQERQIRTGVDTAIDTLTFASGETRGAVFLLGGSGGTMQDLVPRFIAPIGAAGYDLVAVDYPGVGKSTGNVRDEADVELAVSAAYDWLTHLYPEDRIVIAGFSFGTFPAAWLGCRHHPQRLVLVAPFYSLDEIFRAEHPYLPARLLLFPMRTDLELPRCSAVPVTLVHGSNDDVIPVGASERLRGLLKPSDNLMIVAGAGHSDLPSNPSFQDAFRQILENGVRPLAAPPRGVVIR